MPVALQKLDLHQQACEIAEKGRFWCKLRFQSANGKCYLHLEWCKWQVQFALGMVQIQVQIAPRFAPSKCKLRCKHSANCTSICTIQVQIEVQTRCKLHLDLHHPSANRGATCTWICTSRVLLELKTVLLRGWMLAFLRGLDWEVLRGFDATI